jgi:hypothetical protein
MPNEYHGLDWLKREVSACLMHLQETPTHKERLRLEKYLHLACLEAINVERHNAYEQGHEEALDELAQNDLHS